jgi:glycosyltransferase involved in cell wall biosynthesis
LNQAAQMAKELNPDFVYMRYSIGFANWMPSLRKQLGSVPLVVEVNSFLSQRIPKAGILERRFIGASSHVLTISETNRRQMAEHFGAHFGVPVSVIPNGVDVDRFPNWKDSLQRSVGEHIRAGYTGVLKPGYGQEVLIDGVLKARRQCPALSLHIYGDGPYRQELVRYVGDRPGVTFHGPQPFEAMPEIISGLDILLNAASQVNAFQSPIKVYEYMASGRPIISARTPQVELLLEGDSHGLTYEPENPDDLAETILKLIRNEDLARSLANSARKAVASQHTWPKRIESLLADLHR